MGGVQITGQTFWCNSSLFGDVEGLLSSTEELRDSSHLNHMLCVSNSTPTMSLLLTAFQSTLDHRRSRTGSSQDIQLPQDRNLETHLNSE